ncbi:MAG: hypothetical protein LBE91_07810 [Tannerella sp.]|nr:hypothetical protein [Tannerella sp.]
MREVDGKYYLYFSESSIKVESCSALERTMTLKLTCPYVFGDDKEREIVTFWEADDLERPDMVCYRIEFDGEEITGITHIFNYLYEATIILDR